MRICKCEINMIAVLQALHPPWWLKTLEAAARLRLVPDVTRIARVGSGPAIDGYLQQGPPSAHVPQACGRTWLPRQPLLCTCGWSWQCPLLASPRPYPAAYQPMKEHPQWNFALPECGLPAHLVVHLVQ